jgi:glycosyltransferase involved in cell wall biosynthesis
VTVLYFADTRFPIERANGAQTMATCRALAERGHDVTLVVRPDTAPSPRDPFAFYGATRPERMTIRTIGGAPGTHLRRLRFLVEAAATASGSAGVIVTRDLGLATFLLRAPMPGRMRLVYESHGIADVVSGEMPILLGRPDLVPSPSKLRRLARREELVWRRASAYVTITQALADDLRARFGPRPDVHVVPDGGPAYIDVPAPRGSDSRRVIVGYAGHLYPWKGVDVLIQALATLPDIEGLVIGGHAAERDLARVQSLAASLGLADRVALTGQIPPADVARRLADASVLVLPNTPSVISERYTSPLKLFEYLAMGRPIVASDLPSIREVLTHEHTALLVPAGDAGAMAAAIRRLVDDPALADRLASNARALAPRYSWDARAARLESALVAAAA